MRKVRRRQFLMAAGALLAAPLAAEVQQAGKTPRIGFLFLESQSSSAHAATIEAFRASLRDLGYVEGRTITLEYRSAEGRAERLPELAADLVKRRVDVIVTGGGNVSTLAARKATSTVPIVMSSSFAAVESGLVASLARPGANVTGVSVPRELAAKQVELLRELLPSLSRVVVLLRRDPAVAARRAEAKAMAREFLKVTLDYLEVEEPEELTAALLTARASGPNAMIVGPDPLFFQQRDQILDFARTAGLAAMYPFGDFVDAGGLISYSLNSVEPFRVVARQVDMILKGAKPTDLPVEQPTMFEMVINLKTAKALGIKIPQSLLVRADRLIE